jgi:hypothetical protein
MPTFRSYTLGAYALWLIGATILLLALSISVQASCHCSCLALPQGGKAAAVCDDPSEVATGLAAVTCPADKYCPMPSDASQSPSKDPQPAGCAQIRVLGGDGVYHFERVCR